MDAEPFKVQIPDAALEDLRERLARTRWPDEITDSGWEYGSNLAYVKELVEYWRTQFDWRCQEQAINAFAHFRATLDGLGIHFIHERGKGPNPLPIIITHGWPSSFFEWLKMIPRLTDPASHGGAREDSFDVVVPSLPGFGFSDRPSQPGTSVRAVSPLWHRLMTEGLGYQRFAAAGTDWGAPVSSRLAFDYPDQVVGIYVNSVSGVLGIPREALSEAERTMLDGRDGWWQDEGGYAHIQGTNPQTLSYGLNDSPAGLAAWIVEKWRSWSDCGGDVECRYTKDELLTNIMIYWVTRTINSSVRFYYESQHDPWAFKHGERIRVPCAIGLFPKEHNLPPREWAERAYNVQRWSEMPKGGHFPAMEEPDLLAEDMRAFFRPLRG